MEDPSLTNQMLSLDRGSIIADRYEIKERIGNDSGGLVFLCLDREIKNLVILKLLYPSLSQDENVFKRFRNEVLLAKTLSHSNIVQTYDIAHAEEGFYYISIQFFGGKSLKENLSEDHSNFSFKKIIEIFLPVLEGMAYAHGKNIIHRDLRPANILISDKGEVKLTGFGTARIPNLDSSSLQVGQIKNNPEYLSPEQIRGEKLGVATDIYSLGIIAYEMVTGKKPFEAESPATLADKHLNEPIPPFSNLRFEVPQWFQELILKATAKNKKERYHSVTVMMADIIKHMPTPNPLTVAGQINSETPLVKRRAGKPVLDEQNFVMGAMTGVTAERGVQFSLDLENSQKDKSSDTTVSLKSKYKNSFVSLFLLLLFLPMFSLIVLRFTPTIKELILEPDQKIANNQQDKKQLKSEIETSKEVDEISDKPKTKIIQPQIPEKQELPKAPSKPSIDDPISEPSELKSTINFTTPEKIPPVTNPESPQKPYLPEMNSSKSPVKPQPPPPVVELPPIVQSPILATKIYSGYFSKDLQANPTYDLALRLELLINDSMVSGSATIDGVGRFLIEGTLNPRGISLVLKNETTSIHLSGSVRNGSLQGAYFLPPSFPRENKRGVWKAELQ